MTRSELIAQLAISDPHLRSRDIEQIVAVVFEAIMDALVRGHTVELRNFGVFGTKRRDARTGHNPRTGEAVSVAAKAVPYFRASRELGRRLNGRGSANGLGRPD
jgi:integration host factor subunit beta